MTNSGFFITFSPEIFNQNGNMFNFKVNNLINYLIKSTSDSTENNVSIPGLRQKKSNKTKNINVSQRILDELIKLKNN
jgi:LDH2 family malate/lactate/ureidoglycolate dehydrogenase